MYGIFVNPIAEEFDANMSTMSMGMAIFLFVSAICSAVLAVLLKPGNIKQIMIAGAALLGLGFWCFSNAQSLAMLAVSIIIISVAVSMYTMLPGNILLAQQFNRFRGRALAISAIGISVAGFILPPSAAWLIEAANWRDAIILIGIVASLLLLLCFGFFIREQSPADKQVTTTGESQSTEDISTKTLFADPRFWFITLIFSLFYSCGLIMAVHNIPFFLSLGLSSSEGAWILALGAVAGLAGKLIYGALVDMFPKKLFLLLLSLQLFSCCLWYIQAGIVEYDNVLYPIVISLMFFTGGTIPMHPYINSRVFGAETVSKTTGFQNALTLPISLMATPLAGFAFDQLGNYQWVFYGCASAMILSAIPTLLLIRQRRQPSG